jgi:hypothetical protein
MCYNQWRRPLSQAPGIDITGHWQYIDTDKAKYNNGTIFASNASTDLGIGLSTDEKSQHLVVQTKGLFFFSWEIIDIVTLLHVSDSVPLPPPVPMSLDLVLLGLSL